MADVGPVVRSVEAQLVDQASGVDTSAPSVSAASAAISTPLVQGDEVLTILPGTLSPDELKRRLADTDAAVVLKVGRSYPAVRAALAETGRLDEAYYVERASTPGQRVLAAADPALQQRMVDFQAELRSSAQAKGEAVRGSVRGGRGGSRAGF